jgi:TfoX/Sxy family transcriptional regulator of competence genes
MVPLDEHLANRLRDLLTGERGLREQRMFGGVGFMIDGNMAVAASRQGGLLLRVPPEETEALLKRAHAEPFVMRGRAMDGWLRVAEEGVRTKRQLERWAAVGVAYARSLPVKR